MDGNRYFSRVGPPLSLVLANMGHGAALTEDFVILTYLNIPHLIFS
jgi:hypothetical protein